MHFSTEVIVRNAIIAAAYFVLTLITYPISFAGIQFRVAEMLLLLCFFRKDYVIGLTIGCTLANLCSSLGAIDALFGLATTLACGLAIGFCRHLVFAAAIPVLVNAFSIGFELWWVLKEPFWISVGFVALGEFVVLFVGYFLVFSFHKKHWFINGIKANQNIDYKF